MSDAATPTRREAAMARLKTLAEKSSDGADRELALAMVEALDVIGSLFERAVLALETIADKPEAL
jgi:hypothetical protein